LCKNFTVFLKIICLGRYFTAAPVIIIVKSPEKGDAKWIGLDRRNQDPAENRKVKRLSGNLKTEALVVGGGLAGILTAHALQTAGVQTVLVDGGRIGQASPATPPPR
jgi:NADPH-dependent 2,4-dienoyl-CoA reductase/sulfur reductase-like enzyme